MKIAQRSVSTEQARDSAIRSGIFTPTSPVAVSVNPRFKVSSVTTGSKWATWVLLRMNEKREPPSKGSRGQTTGPWTEYGYRIPGLGLAEHTPPCSRSGSGLELALGCCSSDCCGLLLRLSLCQF